MTRSVRLLEILQSLRNRRYPVTAAQLAQDLEVSERTIYRDISELIAQGASIEGEAGVGYKLKPGLFLPPLMLNGEETEAVILGLRYVNQKGDEVLTKAAESALAKIVTMLPAKSQEALEVPLAAPGPSIDRYPDNRVPLARLRKAVREQTRLDIVYEDGEGKQSRRAIRPLQISFMDSARVLIAWCEWRQGFRFFRTDRILTATELDAFTERRSELIRRFRAEIDSPKNDSS